MTAAQIGDLNIEYESIGDGSPLLLVMGLGAQLIDWPDDFVERLADRGFRVIRFDNRDVGLSTKMTGIPPTVGRSVAAQVSRRFAKSDYLISDMAADAAGLLDHLGVDQAHVVGASMGGMIAQTIAIEHPHHVASLTSIMSNTGDRRSGRPAVTLLRQMRKFLDTDPDRVMENAILLGRMIAGPHFDEEEARTAIKRANDRNYDPAGTARQTMAIAASPDRTSGLRRLDVPTLVVHGLLDRLVQPSGGVATARAVPGSRLLMFPDMAHDLPRPRWDETLDAIVANTQHAGVSATKVDIHAELST